MQNHLSLTLTTLLFLIATNSFAQIKTPEEFIPEGYALFEKSFGDLNTDGVEDCILLIKKIDSTNIVQDEYRGELDRNRRGIILLFKNKDTYTVAVKNYDCFSSENEDGGVYYAPELSVYPLNNKLYVEYSHGRYGYWKYTFRYQNSDFELIGYDASNNYGPVINTETSINFSTKKKRTRKNTNEDADSGEEVFEETWSTVAINKLLKLSEIQDFDELTMYDY